MENGDDIQIEPIVTLNPVEQKKLNRRASDKLKDLSERDLLISHSTNISFLCKLMTSHGKKLDNHIDKIEKQCFQKHSKIEKTQSEIYDKMDTKVDSVTFRWLNRTIIGILVVLFGVVGIGVIQSSNNKMSITQNAKEIKLHSESLDAQHKEVKEVLKRVSNDIAEMKYSNFNNHNHLK